MRLLRITLPLVAGIAWSGTARAQATTWLYAGGGTGVVDRSESETLSHVQVDVGLGLPSTSTLVWGVLFRMQAMPARGADLGVLSRFVSRGYAQGDWGFGLDAGVYQRWWGENSTGATANAVLGAPWGLTLLAGGSSGSGGDRGYFVSLGLDFTRLTIHRQSGLDWFANPMRTPRAD